MTVCRVVAQNERADLFSASPFMDPTTREVGTRIRNGGY